MSEEGNIDLILEGTLPTESKTTYLKAWNDFIKIMNIHEQPTEENFIKYFDFLRTEKQQKASTIWCTYSKLNSIYQRNFNQKLQIYPRLTQLLKSYNENYSRKVSKVFEKSQIYDYLSMQDDSPFHIVRRAVVSIAISGGLRSSEMRMLTFKDVILKGDVYEITLFKGRNKTVRKKRPCSSFLLLLLFTLTNYIKTLTAVIGEPSGAFVKGTPIKKCSGISKFVDQPMGKNMLYLFGKDVAISIFRFLFRESGIWTLYLYFYLICFDDLTFIIVSLSRL